MHERIRKLRKTKGLTMEKFGEKLGVGKTAISKIENGERNITEQMFKSICREFNVDEDWLRTGAGGDAKMFKPLSSTALNELKQKYDLTKHDFEFIEKFLSIKPEARDIVADFFIETAKKFIPQEFQDISSNPNPITDLDIDEEIEEYRHDLEIQKKAEEKSSVSDGISDTKENKIG